MRYNIPYTNETETLMEIARYQRTVCTDEEYTKFLKVNGIPKVM